VSGPFQAGATLTVAGTQTTTTGPVAVGHESERGPRITTPNSGGDEPGQAEALPAPQAEGAGAQPQDQEPEQPLPTLNLDGVDLMLSAQPVRFEDTGEHESDATTSDEVSQASAPWWSLLLLTGTSLAARSLPVRQQQTRRRQASLRTDPEDPVR